MPVPHRGSFSALSAKVFAASLIAMPFFGQAASVDAGTDETVIRELNAGYVRAFMNSDAAWYDRHLTPDFTCILTTGAVVDRAAFLENAKQAHTVVSYDLSEVGIRVHGDAALVTALGTWRRRDGTSGRTRYIDVWVRTAGVWKAVSAQLTAVP